MPISLTRYRRVATNSCRASAWRPTGTARASADRASAPQGLRRDGIAELRDEGGVLAGGEPASAQHSNARCRSSSRRVTADAAKGASRTSARAGPRQRSSAPGGHAPPRRGRRAGARRRNGRGGRSDPGRGGPGRRRSASRPDGSTTPGPRVVAERSPKPRHEDLDHLRRARQRFDPQVGRPGDRPTAPRWHAARGRPAGRAGEGLRAGRYRDRPAPRAGPRMPKSRELRGCRASAARTLPMTVFSANTGDSAEATGARHDTRRPCANRADRNAGRPRDRRSSRTGPDGAGTSDAPPSPS